MRTADLDQRAVGGGRSFRNPWDANTMTAVWFYWETHALWRCRNAAAVHWENGVCCILVALVLGVNRQTVMAGDW